jgi:hypothetical protein
MGANSRAAAVLAGLGRTAADVAAGLEAGGVRGVRNTAWSLNPVVRYLQSRIAAATRSIDVTRTDSVRLVYPDGSEEFVPLPQPVRDFLDGFDRGDYPHLEVP